MPKQYYRYTQIWFWLGIPAFITISVVIILMVFKGSFGYL